MGGPTAAELRTLRDVLKAAETVWREEERAFRAELLRARLSVVEERTRRRRDTDTAILAALRRGEPVRKICRDLGVGPHRVVALRAVLGVPGRDRDRAGTPPAGAPESPAPLARAR